MSEFNRCVECGDIFEDNYSTKGKCPACYMPVALEKIEKMKAVIKELLESVEYWSEYDVPLGIVDRMKKAIDKTP